MIEPSANEVPDVAWEYWGWIDTMRQHPGMYGLDGKRAECHDRLRKHYKLDKEKTRTVTDHLDKYENAAQMHDAFLLLKESK